MSLIARRNFLFGAIAAPAIVRASSLMAISPLPELVPASFWLDPQGDYWGSVNLSALIMNVRPIKTPFVEWRAATAS